MHQALGVVLLAGKTFGSRFYSAFRSCFYSITYTCSLVFHCAFLKFLQKLTVFCCSGVCQICFVVLSTVDPVVGEHVQNVTVDWIVALMLSTRLGLFVEHLRASQRFRPKRLE